MINESESTGAAARLVMELSSDGFVSLVNTLADELEAALATGPDLAGMGTLEALSERLAESSYILAHAVTANELVCGMQRRLMRRIDALVEVHGLPGTPCEGNSYGMVRASYFGPRFAGKPSNVANDNNPFAEDVPF